MIFRIIVIFVFNLLLKCNRFSCSHILKTMKICNKLSQLPQLSCFTTFNKEEKYVIFIFELYVGMIS